MGKVIYKNWTPDQKLEEFQAKIFTEVSGVPASADEIRERNNQRDAEMTRYALTENGEPLSYVTCRDEAANPGRSYISFPWALPNCPPDVQEELFNHQLSYLKSREKTKEIKSVFVLNPEITKTQFEFMKKKGFEIEEYIFRYHLDYDVKEITNWKLDEQEQQLTSRQASDNDLNLLMEIANADTELRNEWNTEDDMKSYFTDRVLKDGHAILLFDDEKIIAASAALRFNPNGLHLLGDEERIVMRFTAIRPEYPHAWKRLVYEIAKECEKVGWTDIPLRIQSYYTSNSTIAIGLQSVKHNWRAWEVIWRLPSK